MVKIIAHRNNVLGPDKKTENTIFGIKKALKLGFNVEVDVWKIEESDTFVLGHDEPVLDEIIDDSLLMDERVWVHCKNEEAYEELSRIEGIKCFMQDDEPEAFVSNHKGSKQDLIINHSDNRMISKNRIIVFLGNYEDFEKVYKSKMFPFGIITDYPLSFVEGFK